MDLQLAFAAQLPDPATHREQISMTQQVQALVVTKNVSGSAARGPRRRQAATRSGPAAPWADPPNAPV